MEQDALHLLQQLNAQIDAILISGDIAYRADPEEYSVAAEWLDSLANKVGCSQKNVFTVPGNHDVDRSIVGNDILVQSVRNNVLGAKLNERSERLFGVLHNSETGKALMRPLEAYNEFAARYECSTYLPKPFWIFDLEIEPGFFLRMYGLNSAIMSGPEDVEGKLFLGDIQTAFKEEEGVACLAMMHHPPEWLADKDTVDDALNNGARIQLVGHKHRNRCLLSQFGVRLMAGALHPDRRELDWEPGYNILSVRVESGDKTQELVIESHIRVLQQAPDQFVAKLDQSQSDVWVKRYPLKGKKTAESRTGEAQTGTKSTTEDNRPTMTQKSRELVFRFWNLKPSQRRYIASELALLAEGDLVLPEHERYRRAFMNARDEGKIGDLERAIYNAEES